MVSLFGRGFDSRQLHFSRRSESYSGFCVFNSFYSKFYMQHKSATQGAMPCNASAGIIKNIINFYKFYLKNTGFDAYTKPSVAKILRPAISFSNFIFTECIPSFNWYLNKSKSIRW